MTQPDGWITRTVFGVGRTERLVSIQIDVVDDAANPGAMKSVLVSPVLVPPPSGSGAGLVPASAILSVTSTVYNPDGTVGQTTDADGHVTRFEYDQASRQTASIEVMAGGRLLRTETDYDKSGRRIATRDALRRETLFGYDDAGNVTQTIFVDGTTTGAAYDHQGRKTAETDQLGLATNFEFDKRGNLVAVVQPEIFDPELARRVRPRYEYAYDRYSNHVSIKTKVRQITNADADPPSGGAPAAPSIDRSAARETKFTYDEHRRQVSRTLPAVTGDSGPRTETTAYDPKGRVTLMTDMKGQVAEFTYDDAADPLGRVKEKKYHRSAADRTAGVAPAEVWAFSYDAYDMRHL